MSASSTFSTSAGRSGFMKLVCRSTRRFWSRYRRSTTSPWSASDVIPEVSIFGKDPRICLIGPSSRRRTCEIGTIVSPISSRAERATAVYITHPYLWNRTPAWVRIWSRGIGPSTATLRPARLFMSFITNTSRRLPARQDPAPSVPVAASAGGRRGRGRPGRGHLVPDAAGCVDAIALGLAGSAVRDVGVERVPVVHGLGCAVGAGDRAELSGDSVPSRGGAHRRRPELRAEAVTLRRGPGIRGKRVEGEALRVGQHSGTANRCGLQRAAGRGRARPGAWRRAGRTAQADDELPHAATIRAAATTVARPSQPIHRGCFP